MRSKSSGRTQRPKPCAGACEPDPRTPKQPQGPPSERARAALAAVDRQTGRPSAYGSGRGPEISSSLSARDAADNSPVRVLTSRPSASKNSVVGKPR